MINDEQFMVSGWEDDVQGVDETYDPKDKEQQMLHACEKGNMEEVKALLETNPELINVTDKDKYTPLHRACYNNNIEVVKFLVQKGANISAKTEMLWQPLHSCCQWNHKECAAVLIQNGADVNATTEGNQTPLHIAASHAASYETVQLLLLHPYIDPSIKNNRGETAADIARRSSRYYNIFDIADPLLDTKNLRCLK
ncbi:hypothetical protein NQ315_000872 [Exocentrus adspersus]|uniref:Ankyrin repeat domain-containing protein 49 n=1 Tax=Exocentrus adspersus TaxID=1586481 RepID=A0AAV8WEY9_9CUCU|nr:hypothetical protein NQ315_000872 [Exocentrus adspersus]